MIESGLEVSVDAQQRLDLIYKAVNKNNSRMDFNSFTQALVKVADYLFRGVVENSG